MSARILIFLAFRLFAVIYVKCTSIPKTLEIVYPHIIESRNYAGDKIIKISEAITLNLKKSSVVSKDFLLRTYQDDVMEHNYLDGEILEEHLYHDSDSFASVIVHHANGLKVEGIVSPELGIKPMSTEERSEDGSVPHVLFELPIERSTRKAARSRNLFSSVYSPYYHSQKRHLSKVYAELCIIVDVAFRYQFESKNSMLTYLLITTNSVNMKFLTVSEPEVGIILRSVEVLNRKTEAEFLVRNGSKRVKDRETLFKLQRYAIHNYQKYYTFDLVYFITGLDMGQYYFNGWDSDIQGIAFIGGVCTIDKFAMGEDKAHTYSGVRVQAHEIGHLLGCPHDGERSTFFSSQNCSDSLGFIMTYWSNTSRSSKFSPCCNQAISELARSTFGDCLETKNATRRINKDLDTKLLPGDVLTNDQVCKLAFPTVTDIRFVTDEGIARCKARCCSEAKNVTLQTILPDHSPCNETNAQGKPMVCINGDCTARNDDYKYPVKPAKMPKTKRLK